MKIKIYKVITWLILLSYLKPYNASLIMPLNYFYMIIKVGSTAVILGLVFRERIVLSKTFKICLVFVGVWLISILLNNKGFGGMLQQLVSIIGLICLFSYLKRMDDGVEYLHKVLHHIAIVYIVLQFITVIRDKPLFAEAVVSYDKYFLGGDNYSAFILLPLAAFLLSYELENKDKISFYAWIIVMVGFLCLFIPFSVAGIVAYGFYMFMMLFKSFPYLKKIFSIRNTIIILTVFVGIIVVISSGEGFEFYVLGKAGLNSREIIWVKVINAFIKKPFIGYGVLTEEQVNSYLLYGANHAHNFVLEFILSTGIVGTVLITWWLYRCIKGARILNSNVLDSLIQCFVAYILCGIFDFYIGLVYFWLLILFIDSYKTVEMKKEGSIIT